MADLAYTLMIMFEMQAQHLFEFEFKSLEKDLKKYRKNCKALGIEEDDEMVRLLDRTVIYNLPIEEDDFFGFGKRKIVTRNATIDKLNHMNFDETPDFIFNYDFGDGWSIKLHFEGMEKREVILYDMPQVIAGEGFGIVENIGGPYGLEATYKTVHNPQSPDYAHFKQFLDEQKIDLDRFDIDDLNFRLGKLLRIYKMIYEQGRNPSKKTMAILDRDYY